MAFILWRPSPNGLAEYVTEWVPGGQAAHSPNRDQALRYQTRAAAQAAIERRTPAGWQVLDEAEEE
jgi:hypothetical protein